MMGRGLKGVDIPPPVTRLENQVIATDELLETATKDKSGKIMTTAKQ